MTQFSIDTLVAMASAMRGQGTLLLPFAWQGPLEAWMENAVPGKVDHRKHTLWDEVVNEFFVCGIPVAYANCNLPTGVNHDNTSIVTWPDGTEHLANTNRWRIPRG